jgi:preprotein translocase subunit SecE
MSRVTEFPDEDEERSLREEPAREVRGGGDDGGERTSRLPKLSFGRRIGEFYHNVKLEMRKTTWPTRNEVWSTTVVVLIAVVFFGFYLWGIDSLITLGFKALNKALGGGQ